ncbi:hypothetical protein Q8791_23645 [Nocardiopsis sp. CT-R113]|uniref:Small CPxCG-related zinc finger protein n=1 Tax=Nocardiopsis codii TaxID=3065942 RepID=A0ABU7KE75_9ACTN|nr:hypothetical protein [Nocardiopsis sp. CT-R113]MEE2040214.1 hypothetical protein [Nocardiopsis sp. CT-R113]
MAATLTAAPIATILVVFIGLEDDFCPECEEARAEGYSACGECGAPDEQWEVTTPSEAWEV